MPGFDGKGPLSKGPMTGRGMGWCAVKLPNSEPTAEQNMLNDDNARVGRRFQRLYRRAQHGVGRLPGFGRGW